MVPGNEISVNAAGSPGRTTRLPLLVDLCLTLSQIIVLVLAVITAFLSILANVDVITVVLRTAAAILCVGLPLYILNYFIGRFYVKATLEEMEQKLAEIKSANDRDEELRGELETQA